MNYYNIPPESESESEAHYYVIDFRNLFVSLDGPTGSWGYHYSVDCGDDITTVVKGVVMVANDGVIWVARDGIPCSLGKLWGKTAVFTPPIVYNYPKNAPEYLTPEEIRTKILIQGWEEMCADLAKVGFTCRNQHLVLADDAQPIKAELSKGDWEKMRVDLFEMVLHDEFSVDDWEQMYRDLGVEYKKIWGCDEMPKKPSVWSRAWGLDSSLDCAEEEEEEEEGEEEEVEVLSKL